MTTIIDVDAHFEPGGDWLAPYPELAAKLPKLDPALLAVDAIVGDLLRDVPEAARPPVSELLPPGLLTLFGNEKLAEAERRKEFEAGESPAATSRAARRSRAEPRPEFEGKAQFQTANAQARVQWLDQQGIAIQNVICLSGIAYTLLLPEPTLRQEVIRTCNRWLADSCDEAKGRLLPVTALEYTDLDFVVAELEAMRARGSRIFLIPAYPVNGVPPAHPSWDRIWAAAVALGMAPMLHTGFEHMRFDPGWANLGGGVTELRMLGGATGTSHP